MNSISIIEAVNTTSLTFQGQQIITAMAAGVAYVAMKPVVEGIGLDWASQFVKLKKQGEKFGCCDITIPSLGGLQKMICIPLKKLNGWLFSINPAKVRDDIRDRLVRYQEECFTALHDYWNKGVAIRPTETTADDRTPLRGIVNRIMGKYGLTYQAVYKLVHKEFGVNHIDQLSPKQTAEAIEYLAGKAIEGEWMPKQNPVQVRQDRFSDDDIVSFCYLQIWMEKAQRVSKEIYPAIRQLGSEFSGIMYDLGNESRFVTKPTRDILMREIQNLDMNKVKIRNAEGMIRHFKETKELH